MAVERFPVEASHILMFARAIGDTNPIYSDAAYAAGTEVGSIIAPPTFAQSSAQFDPDYYLRPKPDEKWFGSGRTASGTLARDRDDVGGDGGGADQDGADQPGQQPDPQSGAAAGGLHAEQHFTYHRHLKPGDVLHTVTYQGEAWEKQSKRAGILKFTETVTEYRDQDDSLVITAKGVGVVTEKVIDG